MSDELTDLRHKLDEIERRTAVWRSQVIVLLLVFLAAWVGSALWMKASLEARVEKAEKGVLEKRKTVEAENFVVRDAAGKQWASFGMKTVRKVSPQAYLSFYDERGVERSELSAGQFAMFRPDKNPVVFVLGEEALSGFFLMEPGPNEETSPAFAAWIEQKAGYAIHSKRPMGEKTIGFKEWKAETIAP